MTPRVYETKDVEEIPRIYESRIIETAAPYTSRIGYDDSQYVYDRVSYNRDADDRIRTHRYSNYTKRYDNGYDNSYTRDRVLDSVARLGEYYYINEFGEKIYTKDDSTVNRVTPHYDSYVEVVNPITNTVQRRSFVRNSLSRSLTRTTPRYSESKGKISLDTWRTYREPLDRPRESRVYESVIRDGKVYNIEVNVRPVSYYKSHLNGSTYDNYDGYTSRRVYDNSRPSDIIGSTRIVRSSRSGRNIL